VIDSIDADFLRQAIDISRKAPTSMTCFSVGAVLVDRDRNFVSSGFTQELSEGWHAEAVAIKKAIDTGFNPQGGTIYSSLEPCSVRASGKGDCSTLLIEKEIARVVFAFKEPPTFVIGKGKTKLEIAGIIVEQIKDFEDAVIEINRHLLPSKSSM
jgi:pyrimidine deaminase RibD-like protein